jgi:hypothetical protein
VHARTVCMTYFSTYRYGKGTAKNAAIFNDLWSQHSRESRSRDRNNLCSKQALPSGHLAFLPSHENDPLQALCLDRLAFYMVTPTDCNELRFWTAWLCSRATNIIHSKLCLRTTLLCFRVTESTRITALSSDGTNDPLQTLSLDRLNLF